MGNSSYAMASNKNSLLKNINDGCFCNVTISFKYLSANFYFLKILNTCLNKYDYIEYIYSNIYTVKNKNKQNK